MQGVCTEKMGHRSTNKIHLNYFKAWPLSDYNELSYDKYE